MTSGSDQLSNNVGGGGGGESQTLYNLRWEEYHKIVLESFWTLYDHQTLVDCTLVCSPTESMQVHRLVLSANSPYFRSLLTSHSSHPHPIVILHEVKMPILRMLVNFMYRGWVTCPPEDLPYLLRTAENLQIIGLSQTTQTRQQEPRSSSSSNKTVIKEEFHSSQLSQSTVLSTGSSVVAPTSTSTSTTSHPVYSKKARILEQQSNLYSSNNNAPPVVISNASYSMPPSVVGMHHHSRQISGNSVSNTEPEQLSPLALRKESISAPTTPGGCGEMSSYYSKDYSRYHSSSPEDLNHNDDNDEDDQRLLEEEDNLNSSEMQHDHQHGSSGSRHHSGNNDNDDHHGAGSTSYSSSSNYDSNQFLCPFCPTPQNNFQSRTLLSRHIMVFHPSSYTNLYNNPQSSSSSVDKEEKMLAVTSSSTNNSSNSSSPGIICKFCGKQFSEVAQLIQHLPQHTGERPFKCEYCGKAFKLRHHMKDHARVHTGERPFRCSLCGKTFSRSTILKAHEKTHFPKNSQSKEQVSPGSSNSNEFKGLEIFRNNNSDSNQPPPL